MKGREPGFAEQKAQEKKNLAEPLPSEVLSEPYGALLHSLRVARDKMYQQSDTASPLNDSRLLETFANYITAAKQLNVNVMPLQAAFTTLKKLGDGSLQETIVSLDHYIQEHVTDVLWNFHYQQIKCFKADPTATTEEEKEKEKIARDTALAEKLVAALTDDERSALLHQLDAPLPAGIDENFSVNYHIIHDTLADKLKTVEEINFAALLYAALKRYVSIFDKIPADLFEHILDHANPGTMINFSKASDCALTFFKTPSSHYNHTLASSLADKLLYHVVHGEQVAAEFLIKLFPDLLTVHGTVMDYSGRTIQGTALQIALGAEDVKYHDDEECMAEMIERHLLALPNGETTLAEQITEQFPEGWEEQEAARAAKDLEALDQVIKAIADSESDKDDETALQAFKNYLDDQAKNVIKTGKHFNIQLLLKAFEYYAENYDRFGGWNSRKNNTCWRKVIGYIQRFLPACYAQVFCQSVYVIVQGSEKLKRPLEFHNGPGVFFFPLDANPSFLLGRDFAAGGHGCYTTAVGLGEGSRKPWHPWGSYKLCQTKNINVAKVLSSRSAVTRRIGAP